MPEQPVRATKATNVSEGAPIAMGTNIEALHDEAAKFIDGNFGLLSGLPPVERMKECYVQGALRHATLSPPFPSPQGVEGLREALARHVRFTAYQSTDPLAIRLEFANDDDRVAAANAIDAALSALPLSGDPI